MALGDEDVVACIPAQHDLARHKTLTPALMATAPLLTLESGHCLRDHAWAACRLTGRRPNEVFQATSLPTLVQMVAAGLGVTLLPRMAVPIETAGKGKGVVIRPLHPGGPARTVALVWRETSTRGDDFKRLGAVLRTATAAAIAAGKETAAKARR
jgi:LysR family hydrogen peroxide-inducible transcriptional activator